MAHDDDLYVYLGPPEARRLARLDDDGRPIAVADMPPGYPRLRVGQTGVRIQLRSAFRPVGTVSGDARSGPGVGQLPRGAEAMTERIDREPRPMLISHLGVRLSQQIPGLGAVCQITGLRSGT